MSSGGCVFSEADRALLKILGPPPGDMEIRVETFEGYTDQAEGVSETCEVFTNKGYVRRGSNSVIIDPNQDIERIRKRVTL